MGGEKVVGKDLNGSGDSVPQFLLENFIYNQLRLLDNGPIFGTALTMKHKITPAIQDYPILRRKVEEALLWGQKKIEEAKVQTYWQTGKIMDEHILRYQSRSDHYGEEVIGKLSSDIHVSTSVLWRCVKFARSFKKIVAARPQSLPRLSWAHYRELITVPDEETRLALMTRAEKSGWTSRELGEKIRREIRPGSPQSKPSETKSLKKLIPKKGRLYTYRLIAPDSLHQEDNEGLWVDLGFQVYRQMAGVFASGGRFKENQIIESLKKDGDYGVSATTRTKEDLFTYKGYVQRVVDGDTLLVKVDLGFETRVRQYLRLRGVDAPELITPEGKKAKTFVERELKKIPFIILTSSRSDKYDRYLADIWIPSTNDASRDTNDDVYLNQLLLDEGIAQRAQ